MLGILTLIALITLLIMIFEGVFYLILGVFANPWIFAIIAICLTAIWVTKAIKGDKQ